MKKIDKIFNKIKQEYHKNDICMAELLASTPLILTEKDNVSIEDIFELYMRAMKWADGDDYIRI